jgi:hypothetical protein
MLNIELDLIAAGPIFQAGMPGGSRSGRGRLLLFGFCCGLGLDHGIGSALD